MTSLHQSTDDGWLVEMAHWQAKRLFWGTSPNSCPLSVEKCVKASTALSMTLGMREMNIVQDCIWKAIGLNIILTLTSKVDQISLAPLPTSSKLKNVITGLTTTWLSISKHREPTFIWRQNLLKRQKQRHEHVGEEKWRGKWPEEVGTFDPLPDSFWRLRDIFPWGFSSRLFKVPRSVYG